MPGLKDRRRIPPALLAPPFLYCNASTGTIVDGNRHAPHVSALTVHTAVIPTAVIAAGALPGERLAFPACGTGAEIAGS
jgi:hypothetical protein